LFLLNAQTIHPQVLNLENYCVFCIRIYGLKIRNFTLKLLVLRLEGNLCYNNYIVLFKLVCLMKKFSFKNLILGQPLNILNPKIKDNIALIAIIAWVGLGADGLSSAAYGPAEAYAALNGQNHIAVYLAIATAISIFIICFSYNQVIELFPRGGGGYKVATHLLGPKTGLISGSALIVDYMLTIAVSIASCVDALFSTLPVIFSNVKVEVEVLIIILLIILNLRGLKESIKVLVPLFLGFVVTHIFFFAAGFIYYPHEILPTLFPTNSVDLNHTQPIGVLFTIAIFLRAYSLGGGTYTGLEAVSNNVNILAEPKVKTGKITMLYMAISLSIAAGSFILLFLLWNVKETTGQTLNAVVFNKISAAAGINHWMVDITLVFEATLLLVGANTGILGCPAVMANMAVDKWLPKQFKELSSRLVTQNGILIAGIGAILILIYAKGSVPALVILYSINVFITFCLSLLGLCVYWLRVKKQRQAWFKKFFLAGTGFILCFGILILNLYEKFSHGGWLTILMPTVIIVVCLAIRKHYFKVDSQLKKVDELFYSQLNVSNIDHSQLIAADNKNSKTAVFFVNDHIGSGIHTILWVRRLFPNVFQNYVFLTAGEIDSDLLANNTIYRKFYRQDLNTLIEKYRLYCTQNNLPSDGLFSYGVDSTEELVKLAESVQQIYPDCVFFASKLVFKYENRWTKLLHNNVVNNLQRDLHLNGKQMVILPMQL
jgi:amino acid transporter